MILQMVLRATPKDFGNISNLGYTLEAPFGDPVSDTQEKSDLLNDIFA